MLKSQDAEAWRWYGAGSRPSTTMFLGGAYTVKRLAVPIDRAQT